MLNQDSFYRSLTEVTRGFGGAGVQGLGGRGREGRGCRVWGEERQAGDVLLHK
jgi:hypothetical protein